MLKNKEGFTLIELVMIIVILGILAAVALPKYQDMAREARQAVVDGVAGALKSAAVITFAKNRGGKASFDAISAQLNYDHVIITGPCSAATVKHVDDTNASAIVDISEYCAG